MSDFIFSDAGSLFFGLWTAVVAALSILAFGRDLIPASLRPLPRPIQQDRQSSPESLEGNLR
jgi:hypothetical protein